MPAFLTGAGALGGCNRAPHLPQNLAAGLFSAWQFGHLTFPAGAGTLRGSSRAPHLLQNAAASRFSAWHFGHFIFYPLDPTSGVMQPDGYAQPARRVRASHRSAVICAPCRWA